MWNVVVPDRQSFETMEQVRLDATVQTMLQQGNVNFKDNVTSPSDLPLLGNTLDDFRLALSNGRVYRRNGSAWVLPAWGSGGAWLSTYPIQNNKVTLNPDGLTVSMFDGLEWASLSNGNAWYDAGMTFPLFPNEIVPSGFWLPLMLWSYDDWVTIQYEWTSGVLIDLMWLIPPLNFSNQTRPWAVLFGFWVAINFTGLPLTTGIDAFSIIDNWVNWVLNRFYMWFEDFNVNTNPGFYLNYGGSGFITNNLEFHVSSWSGGWDFTIGSALDDNYCQWLTVLPWETGTFVIVFAENLFIVPQQMDPQWVNILWFVDIQNTSINNWTRGTDPLNSSDIVVSVQNIIPWSYIWEYATVGDIATGWIIPSEWQRAYITGNGLYDYINGVWTASSGGGGGTPYSATAGSDFSAYSWPVPVRISWNQVSLLPKVNNSSQSIILWGWFAYPASVQLDQRTVVNIATNVNMSPWDIVFSVSNFWPNWSLVPSGSTSSLLTNARIDLPTTIMRIDKTHVAVGYVDNTNDAHIAVVEIPNNSNVLILVSDRVIESNVTAFRITHSGNGVNTQQNTPQNIAFAWYTTTTGEWFFGNVQLGYYYNLLTPTITSMPAYTTAASWTNFAFAGMASSWDPYCVILLRTAADTLILVQPRSGTIVDAITYTTSPTFALSLKYIEDTYFVLMEVRPTNDILASVIDISWFASISIGSPTTIDTNFNRVVAQQSCDIGAFRNWNWFVNPVIEFVYCTDDGMWFLTFETRARAFSAGVIWAEVGTLSTAVWQSATNKQICVNTYRDNTVYSLRNVMIWFVNNLSDGLTIYEVSSSTGGWSATLSPTTKSIWNATDCVGLIQWGATLWATVTVYPTGSKMAATGATGVVYANVDWETIVSGVLTNLMLGYGTGANELIVDIWTPKLSTYIVDWQGTPPNSGVDNYLIYGQFSLTLDSTVTNMYTPEIKITALQDNCSIYIFNIDQSCMNITPIPTTIYDRPSLFSKKWSYIVIKRIEDMCDAGWYIVEDGRTKEESVVLVPSDIDIYDTNFLYVPRKYSGIQIIEFGDGTIATEIIERVYSDNDEIQLLPYNNTDIQIDFTAAASPPDIWDILWPVASTTFIAANKDDIKIKKISTTNVQSKIWKQVIANNNL